MEAEQIPKDNSIIDIQIVSNKESLNNFASFLNLLDELYQGLCRAHGIHYTEHPLNIINIESGSIWAKLHGNNHIISLIKDLIFGMGNHIRDLQTGKISLTSFENKVKKAEILIDLNNKAKENGVSEGNLLLFDKVICQAIENISKSLPKSTTEIIIDDKPILHLSKAEQKKIENNAPKMIEDKKGKALVHNKL